MTRLLQAQRALQSQSPDRAKWQTIVGSLRDSVPEAILAHFLRLVTGGGAGVALVRHGVCSACHIRVPSGLVLVLVKPHDVPVCDHCGAYLLLPDDEMPIASVASVPLPTRRGRKCRRALAA